MHSRLASSATVCIGLSLPSQSTCLPDSINKVAAGVNTAKCLPNLRSLLTFPVGDLEIHWENLLWKPKIICTPDPKQIIPSCSYHLSKYLYYRLSLFSTLYKIRSNDFYLKNGYHRLIRNNTVKVKEEMNDKYGNNIIIIYNRLSINKKRYVHKKNICYIRIYIEMQCINQIYDKKYSIRLNVKYNCMYYRYYTYRILNFNFHLGIIIYSRRETSWSRCSQSWLFLMCSYIIWIYNLQISASIIYLEWHLFTMYIDIKLFSYILSLMYDNDVTKDVSSS